MFTKLKLKLDIEAALIASRVKDLRDSDKCPYCHRYAQGCEPPEVTNIKNILLNSKDLKGKELQVIKEDEIEEEILEDEHGNIDHIHIEKLKNKKEIVNNIKFKKRVKIGQLIKVGLQKNNRE